ncbi:unnamed protein product [Cunninghamella echinulata]
MQDYQKKKEKRKKVDTGQVPLVGTDKAEWYGIIEVGMPPKEFTVLIDTGSSDLILPSIECNTTCDGHKKYTGSDSSTSSELNDSKTIQFENGETISGTVYTDSVTMGGLNVPSQHLFAPNSYPSSLATDKFSPDGILGLGFQTQSQIQQSPFFQSLYQTNQLDAGVFGLSLKNSGANLFLGGVNSAEFQGEITYTPITLEGAWQIDVNSIQAEGSLVFKDKLNAYVDSGSEPIITDPHTAEKIFSSIPGSKRSAVDENIYVVPCDSIPSISFTIGGKMFSIDPSLFNLGKEVEGSSYCVCALMGTGNDPNTLILGSVFLQNVYSVFDMKESRIGFADLA